MPQPMRRLGSLALVAGAIIACQDTTSPPTRPQARLQPSRASGPEVVPGQYVVVLRRDVTDAPGVARRLAAQSGGRLRHVYTAALRGFSVSNVPAAAVA